MEKDDSAVAWEDQNCRAEVNMTELYRRERTITTLGSLYVVTGNCRIHVLSRDLRRESFSLKLISFFRGGLCR